MEALGRTLTTAQPHWTDNNIYKETAATAGPKWWVHSALWDPSFMQLSLTSKKDECFWTSEANVLWIFYHDVLW